MRQYELKHLKQANITVPMKSIDMPAYFSFSGSSIDTRFLESKFCVGTSKFPSDYILGSTVNVQPIYEIILINATNKALLYLTSRSDEQSFLILLPFESPLDKSIVIQVYICTLYAIYFLIIPKIYFSVSYGLMDLVG